MSNNFTYDTRFTASNMASSVVMQYSNDLNNLKISVDDVGRSADNTSKSFRGLNTSISTGGFSAGWKNTNQSVKDTTNSLMAMRGALFGVQMALFTSSMLISNMMAIETTTNQVETAQQRLNTLQREGKRGTDEYRNAVRQLETAQINLNRAQTMTNIMTGSMALQFASMGLAFMQAIPSINKAGAALQRFNAISIITKALSGPGGWATLLGGIAVAGIAGATIYGVSQQMSPKQNITVEISNKDIIQEYLQRTQGHAVKMYGAS